jgi:hypothetical protein
MFEQKKKFTCLVKTLKAFLRIQKLKNSRKELLAKALK